MSNHHAPEFATAEDLKRLYDFLSSMHRDWVWLARVMLGVILAMPVLFVLALALA